MTKNLNAVLIVITLLVSSCASTPTGRSQLKLMSDSQMDGMGDQSFQEMKKTLKISKNENQTNYVRCVAERILKSEGRKVSEWEIVVFEDKAANAFALPGRNIGVYTGMLEIANDQAELAAIIGHEIAHVDADHGNERVSQNVLVQGSMSIAQISMAASGNENAQLIMAGLGLGAQFGIMLPFSRKHESEADLLGLKYMSKAGFDPRGSVRLWQKMSKAGKSMPEFLSTHPNPSTRIEDLNANMEQALAAYEQQPNRPNCKL